MKVGLALGAGGARGIAHIAYLEVLDQLGIVPTEIAGSSIGALIGAFYAAGMPAREIRRLAQSFSILDAAKIVDFSGARESGIIKGRKVVDWIAANLPAERFEDLEIPLRVVATDFWRKEEVVYESGDLVPALRGSISIPGLFEPYQYGERLLVDGGVVNPVPFDRVGGAEFVIGIDVAGERAISFEKPAGRIEVILGVYAIMGKIITEGRARDERVSVYVKPDLARFGLLEFLRAREILESVREDAEFFRRILLDRLAAPG